MQYPKIDLSKTTPDMVGYLLKARKHLAKSHDDELKSANKKVVKDVYICFAIGLSCTDGGSIAVPREHPAKALKSLILKAIAPNGSFESWVCEFNPDVEIDDDMELQSHRLIWVNLMIDQIKAHHAVP